MQGTYMYPSLPKGVASLPMQRAWAWNPVSTFSEPQFSPLYNGSVISSQAEEIK